MASWRGHKGCSAGQQYIKFISRNYDYFVRSLLRVFLISISHFPLLCVHSLSFFLFSCTSFTACSCCCCCCSLCILMATASVFCQLHQFRLLSLLLLLCLFAFSSLFSYPLPLRSSGIIDSSRQQEQTGRQAYGIRWYMFNQHLERESYCNA